QNHLVTVNSALLELTVDTTLTRRSNTLSDTLLLVLQQDSLARDTVGILRSFGKAVGGGRYQFQIRDWLERWNRGQQNNGFEIRAGYAIRTANGIPFSTEDYAINRWDIYGSQTDAAHRPKLRIS